MLTESGTYLIDLLSIFLAFTAFGGIMISLYMYQYKESPGMKYLTLMQLSTATWAIFYCLEYSATALEAKLFWSKLSYLGIVFTPVCFYLFSKHFKSEIRDASPKPGTGLFFTSIILIALVLTNDIHHLHWREAAIDPENNTTIYRYGPFFWIIFIYIYTLLTLSVINILSLIKQATRQTDHAAWLIIIACIVPVTGNIIYVFKINPIPGFDWTPACFLVSGAILAYINIRFGAFELIPLARNKLINIMEDAVLLIDHQQRIADVNESMLNLLNTEHKNLIGRKITEVLPHREEEISRVVLSPKPIRAEIITEKTPEKRHLDMRMTPLFDHNDLLSGQLFVLRDITQRIRNEEKILLSNQQLKKEIEENARLIADLNAYAHTVAHDLKDSIGAVIPLTELIEAEIRNKQYNNALEVTKVICASAEKTLYVINELLTMSTIRQQDVQLVPVAMEQVISECEKRLQASIRQHQAVILKPEKWPSVNSHPGWLEEVWINYMSNAMKYGGTPPVVELGFDSLDDDSRIKFWIKDNGEGIVPEDQEKLFTRFVRLETTRAQGNGLGLPIVRRIVEKLGGEVGVSSQAIPGEGCRFYFILSVN
ncbi:sensor histidine kinase [Gaoshiqia sp. Z1-71]|uniref:sensor histidine kinase n=1 Tax=Gaoshiqia hydrogeniformans TaxID=3290090 RepID=UPI003BF910D4